MTLAELKKDNPALAEEAMAEARAAAAAETADAVENERKRLSDIDEVAGVFDDALVSEAKYGKTACTAQELAYRAAQTAAKKGGEFIAAMNADNAASGAQGVPAAPAPEIAVGKNATEDIVAAAKAAAAKYMETFGGGKRDEQ